MSWQRQHDARDAEDPAVGVDERSALVAALQELPVRQRTAIVLHHLCDLDVTAVAAETGATPSAVKSQLSRGRARLAELLDDPRLAPAETDDAAQGPRLRTTNGRWI